jgi:drug/metabolite transporter (DMT)-like permease
MKLKAHLILLLGNFFFGSSVIAIKMLTPALMPALAINVLRVAAAVTFFWLLGIGAKKSSIFIEKKDIGLLIKCGLCGVVINQLLFVKGTSLTTPISASLLALTTPIAIALISWLLLKEKMGFNKIAGLCLGITGALILILSRNNLDAGTMMLGNVLIILNAVSYALYIVMVKPLTNKYSSLQVIRWIFLIGAVCIIPIGIGDVQLVKWSQMQTQHIVALCFIVFGATVFSYLATMYGIEKLGATIAGSYIYTHPIFATIIAVLFFGETLNFIKIASAILIFCGVFLVNKSPKK